MAKRNRSRSALRIAASVFLALMGAAYSHSQETSSVTLPEIEIRALANRILQGAGKSDCKPGDCSILVANFTLPSGATSQLGMHLADAFSNELASQQQAIQVIERSRFQTYLEQERIPATLLNSEKAIRWLGKQLGATAVLSGTTEDQGAYVRVEVTLRSCEKERTGPVEEFSFPDPDSNTDLNPIDSFSKTVPSSNASTIPLVVRAGVGGVTSPGCSYCPQPNYTNPAREAKFNGTVLLQVTVSAAGSTVESKVVRGVPFGLNAAAVSAIRDWKFKPATREGEPVTCMVMIEATFRLR